MKNCLTCLALLFLASSLCFAGDASSSPGSQNKFSEASRRFCQAIADRDWATVNQFLAPEVRREGKFAYDPNWLTIKPGAVWRHGQSIPFKGEKLIGRESDTCILTVSHITNPPQKSISGMDVPAIPDMERLDLWRVQKSGELVVIPQEHLLSTGIEIKSVSDNAFDLYDSAEIVAKMARIDETVKAMEMDKMLKDYEVMVKKVTLEAKETTARIIKERSAGPQSR